jgi:hypothetical protein
MKKDNSYQSPILTAQLPVDRYVSEEAGFIIIDLLGNGFSVEQIKSICFHAADIANQSLKSK